MIAQINIDTKECRCFDIRKLTPRECGRLMGVQEWALDKMLPTVSSSAAYKLFGNGIVVDVLAAIFRQLYFYEQQPMKAGDEFSLFDEPSWPEKMYDGNMVKIVTLCSGFDCQLLGLEKLKEQHPQFRYDLVAWSEKDPESRRPLERQSAVVAHNAIFPQYANRNMGDMTQPDYTNIQPVTDIDLLTYSTPCTDISQAGKRAGIAEGSGTRSAILWNTAAIIEKFRPRFLLQENVSALVNQLNRPHFDEWRRRLSKLGYTSSWKILNASDFGVPQNRERVFMLSWRNDLHLPDVFPWPEPIPLEKVIADVLETGKDMNPYILKPESTIAFLTKNQQPDDHFIYRVVDTKPTKEEVESILWEELQKGIRDIGVFR